MPIVYFVRFEVLQTLSTTLFIVLNQVDTAGDTFLMPTNI